MTRIALALVVVAGLACKGKQHGDDTPPPPKQPSPVAPRDAAAPADADWGACEAALRAAPKTPAIRRSQTIIAACRPCGDWTPLLAWNHDTTRMSAIKGAMEACKGFCNVDAKQRFMGALSSRGRGNRGRGPWRFLGDICKAEVSAVPDNRYASATWFALDRIARAAAKRPGLADVLAAIDLPLPPVSVSGFGYELPHSPVTAPIVGPIALTVNPKEVRVAVLAHGKPTEHGIETVVHGEPYPGTLVKTAKELDAALAKLDAPLATGAIGLFAPRSMPARRLLDAIALAGPRPRPRTAKHGDVGELRLAVAVDRAPEDWPLAGSIPVALRIGHVNGALSIAVDGDPDRAIAELKQHEPELGKGLEIALGPTTTVEQLAKLLGAAVYFDVKAVTLISKKS